MYEGGRLLHSDRPVATTSPICDFGLRYLINPCASLLYRLVLLSGFSIKLNARMIGH
jgi:hypothetical protein